jgi:hypothetical protein
MTKTNELFIIFSIDNLFEKLWYMNEIIKRQ